jgi:hypothetical protein
MAKCAVGVGVAGAGHARRSRSVFAIAAAVRRTTRLARNEARAAVDGLLGDVDAPSGRIA